MVMGLGPVAPCDIEQSRGDFMLAPYAHSGAGICAYLQRPAFTGEWAVSISVICDSRIMDEFSALLLAFFDPGTLEKNKSALKPSNDL